MGKGEQRAKGRAASFTWQLQGVPWDCAPASAFRLECRPSSEKADLGLQLTSLKGRVVT